MATKKEKWEPDPILCNLLCPGKQKETDKPVQVGCFSDARCSFSPLAHPAPLWLHQPALFLHVLHN